MYLSVAATQRFEARECVEKSQFHCGGSIALLLATIMVANGTCIGGWLLNMRDIHFSHRIRPRLKLTDKVPSKTMRI